MGNSTNIQFELRCIQIDVLFVNDLRSIAAGILNQKETDMIMNAKPTGIEELSFEEIEAVSAGSRRGQIAGAGIVIIGGVVAVAGAPFIAAGVVFAGIVVVVVSGADRPNRDGSSRVQKH